MEIMNLNSNTIVSGSSGDDSITSSGSTVTIDAGAGDDTIEIDYDYDELGNVNINAGDGDDSILVYNSIPDVLVDAGAGNDTIENYTDNATLLGGDGNDYILNWQTQSTINGGEGNDTLDNYGAYSTVSGGKGDDVILSNGQSNVIEYADGDGNDTVEYFGVKDMLRLVDGTIGSTVKNGDNLIVTVGNGTLTFKNISDVPIQILDSDGRMTVMNFSGVTNYSARSVVSGTAGDDSIFNNADSVTLNALDGKDKIINLGADALINGGAGDDSIDNHGSNATIDGGDGNNFIVNIGSGVYNEITWEEFLNGNDVLITTGAGDDTVRAYTWGATIKTGAGNDFIDAAYWDSDKELRLGGRMGSGNMIIDAGEGNDTITGEDNFESTINAGAGNDLISVSSSGLTINGGTGNDTLENAGVSYSSLVGGAGADRIIIRSGGYDNSNGYNNTIRGGTDNDTIDLGTGTVSSYVDLKGNWIEYAAGDGNDVILNFKSEDTISILDDSEFATVADGNDVIITVDGGSMRLINGATVDNIVVVGGTPKDGTSVSATVSNTNSSVLVRGTGGNDVITNSGWRATIDGGAGDDSITNTGRYALVDGGAGNDSIINNRAAIVWDATIKGGAGDDTIAGSTYSATAQYILYASGDGNDVITNYMSYDTIMITDDSDFSMETSGSDVIVRVGDGSITLKDGASKAVTVIKGVYYFHQAMSTLISGTAGSDTIENYAGNSTIFAEAGKDIVKNRGSYTTIDGGEGNDIIENTGNYVSILGGDGDDYINNEVRIGYYDGAYATVRGGKGDDTIMRAHVYQYTAGDGNDVFLRYTNGSTISILDDSEYSTLISDNDLIIKVGDGSIRLVDAATISSVKIVGGTYVKTALDITNSVGNTLITGSALNDTIRNGGENVTINAGEGNDYISLSSSATSNVIRYASGDGDDTVYGFNADDTLNITDGSAYSTVRSGDDVNINFLDGSIKLVGASSKTVNIKGGTLHEGGNIMSNSTSYAFLSGTSGADVINNSGLYVTIDAGAGDDSIRNRDIANGTSINAGSGNDTINNDTSHNVTIDAGAGNDSIYGYYSNSLVVIGGAGNDTITLAGSYSGGTINYASGDGDDVVYYTALDAPIINITDGSKYSTTKSGNDVIVKVGSGSITVKNAKDRTVTVKGGVYSNALSINNSVSNTLISGSDDDDTIKNRGANVTIDAGDGNDFIDINNSSNVSINAGKGNDTIKNNTSDSGSGSSFNLDEGDDYIQLSGYVYSTVNGGNGNDYIFVDEPHNLINGDSGADTIYNVLGNYNTINGGADSDYITNDSGSDVLIDGGSGNDVIYNNTNYHITHADGITETIKGGNNSTLLGGDGNDQLINEGSTVFANAGNGDDTIINYGSRVTLNAGTGNDLIFISGGAQYNIVEYAAGDGNDTIYDLTSTDTIRITDGSNYSTQRSGADVIVSIGSGSILLKDYSSTVNIVGGTQVGVTLSNSTSNTVINGTSIADSIYNGGANATVAGGEGNDTLDNYGSYVLMVGGNGDDHLLNRVGGWGSSLDGGAGNDSVRNYGDGVSINVGNDDDTVENHGYNTTLDGGAGNDVITLGSSSSLNVIQYKSSDGNDTITGYKSDDTIRITDGSNYSTQQSGADVIVSIGSSSITLKDAVDKTLNIDGGSFVEIGTTLNNTTNYVSIVGTSKNDSIYNSQARDVTIDVGDGDDSIYNYYGAAVLINAGTGNDTVYNSGGSSTITGGAGNDTVTNYGARTKIDAGEDADVIINHASEVSMKGGAGNDTLYIHNQSTTVNGGVGNDYITMSDGNNVIEYAAGDGNDTVEGYLSSDTISITDGSKYTTQQSGSDVIVSIGSGSIRLKDYSSTVNISGGTQVGVTLSNSASNTLITGTSIADSIYNNASNVTIDVGAGNDSIYNDNGRYASINAGDGNDYIFNSYGDNVSINGGDGNDSIYNFKGSYSTINAGEGNDFIRNNGNYVSINAGAGNDTIENTGGNNASINAGAGNDSVYNFTNSVTINAGDGDDSIFNHFGDYVSINAGAGADLISLYSGSSQLIEYASGDGDDTIYGLAATDTIEITDGSNYTTQKLGSDVIVSIGSGSIRLKDYSSAVNVVGGTEVGVTLYGSNTPLTGTSSDDLIYNSEASATINAGEGNDSIDNSGDYSTINAGAGNDNIDNGGSYVSINAGAGNDSILTGGENVSINAGAGNDSIYNGSWYVTINAGDGNDYIENYGWDVSINAGAGNDSIYNGSWYVTINAGEGDDFISLDSYSSHNIIEYASGAGDDTIYGLAATDTIEITDGSNYFTLESGSDVIVSLASGSIRIKDYSSIINIVGGTPPEMSIGNSTSNTVINSGSGNDTISNSASRVTINASDGDDLIRNEGSNGLINGGNGLDTITNSARSVTINAGADNDLISLAADNSLNVIKYGNGDGNDTVYGFNSTDTIRITDDSEYSTLKSGSDVIVYIGDGSIRLKNYSANVNIIGGTAPVIEFNPITNDADNVKVAGTSADDYIINTGENVTVQGNGGNDSIDGSDYYGELILFAANHGHDTVSNFGANDTVQITNGSITSSVNGADGLIITVSQNNNVGTITLKDVVAENVTVNGKFITFFTGGATIENDADNVKVAGTDYDDYIINNGEHVTIEGKGGNDLIDNADFAELFMFGAADGHDTISNFGKNDSIRITSGAIRSLVQSGKNYILTVDGVNNAQGTVLLENTADYDFDTLGNVITVKHTNQIINSKDKVTVNGTSGEDYIINTGANVSIDPGAGNDTITGSDSYGELYLLSSASGNNLITNFAANDTLRMTAGRTLTFATVGADVIVTLKGATYTGVETLVGAAGLDFKVVQENKLQNLIVDDINRIVNTANNRLVTGTLERDYITNTGSGVTVSPGAGDDTITGSDAYGEVYQIASNNGKNIITNFGANDTLFMSAGQNMSWSTVGADVIVTLKGKTYTGYETLVGAAGLEFVKSTDGKYLYVNDVPTLTNDKNGVKFTGTSKAEYLLNSGSKVTIDGKGGGDTIEGSNFAELYQFSSAYGDNVILNFDENDTLQMIAGQTMTGAVDGDDYVVTLKGATYTGTVTLKDAAGNNFVINGKYLTVDNGAPTLENYLDGVKFSGTSDAEYMINEGERVTIEPKGGNDTVESAGDYGELINLSSAEGNNVILNFGKNDSLQMTAGRTLSFATVGADVIVTLKGASYTGIETLKGAAGLNFVKSDDGKILYVESDPDPIFNDTDNVKVNGTKEADYIINTAQGVSIAAGAGNDTIEGSDFYGELFMVSSADGNDTITNFGNNDTIYMSAGRTMTWSSKGSDVIVTLKGAAYTGTLTLKDAADKNFVKSTDGKYLVVKSDINYITNNDDNVKVTGGDGDDWIENAGINVTVESKGGNDTIVGSTFEEMFLFSGADGNNRVINFGVDDTLKCTSGTIDKIEKIGDDAIVHLKSGNLLSNITLEGAGEYDFEQTSTVLTVKHVNRIINRSDKRTVEGTTGDDIILNYGEHVTIEANTGNDTMTGSDAYGEMFALSSAHDNNVITNFGYNDTLKMTAGKTLSFATVGADVVVTLKGANYTGIETLKGAAGMNFKKVGSNTLVVDGVTKKLYTKNNTLVGGTEGRDYITSTGSGVTIQGSAGDDTIVGSDEYGEMFQWSSAYGDDVIVNFHANDTLYMAGGKTLNFATVGADVVVSLKGAAYSGTVTLKDAAGLDFKKSSDGRYLTAAGISTIVNYANNAKVVGTAGKDYILNTANGVSIQTGAGNDTIEGSNFAELYLFSSADGNNVVTNFGMNDTLQMTAGKTLTGAVVGDDYVVTLKGASYTGTVTLEGAGGYNFKKSGSTTLYVDVTNKILNTADGVKVTGTSSADYITNIGQNVTVESKGGNDTLEGSDLYGELFNFSSADGNNVILNFGANDTLQMTAGQTMTGAAVGDDYVVTLKGKSYTGTVTLKDMGTESFRVSSDGKTLRMKNTVSNGGSSAMMPAEDYWFLDDESAADEIDAIMSADNLIALDEPTVLATLDGSARFDQLSALDARHQKK